MSILHFLYHKKQPLPPLISEISKEIDGVFMKYAILFLPCDCERILFFFLWTQYLIKTGGMQPSLYSFYVYDSEGTALQCHVSLEGV